ncbi:MULTISPECIES: phosphotransferase [unclassified Mycoplasma]|uniref:phosphotransferase n=1 Tax=unclassified Mycoplasma TaxID=2683645 RepID=UPI00211C3731|nr:MULTISPECIES: phosphotransferase [unclassified Mycoplasma]UUM19795.1 phosphotransferase [Mycoplasma sp. 1578d]UUM24779.1 phosphotransferase [Mycoplasma sp. 3686d]
MNNLVTQHLVLVNKILKVKQVSEINSLTFEYEGFHNYTYSAIINDLKYQVRIKKDFLKEPKKAEALYYLQDLKTLYYDDNLLIREWFEGQTLEKIKLTQEIQIAVLEQLKKFSKLKIQAQEFDWFENEINSPEYSKTIAKFKDQPKVLHHGDLVLKNILINDQNQVRFIDLEWIRSNFFGYDAVALYKEGFDLKLILKHLEITTEQFKDLLFISNVFNQYTYKRDYIDKIKQEVKKIKPIESSSKSSYLLNDRVVQFKNNHQPLLIKNLGEHDFIPFIAYEDEQIILRKWIHEEKFHYCKGTLRRLATKIKKFHQLPNQYSYTINQFIFNLYQKFKDNEWVKQIKPEIIEKIFKILNNPKDLVLSHNDLHQGNIVLSINDGKFKFIDLVNISLNSKYFDLAYLSTNLDLNEDKELHLLKCYDKNTSKEEFYKYKCIVNFYGLLWSLDLQDNFSFDLNVKNIQKYQDYL